MSTRKARAKINLALHVTGQRADKYHLLDTLVVFAVDGDELGFSHSKDTTSSISLSVEGPYAAGLTSGDDNLVLRAASLLHDTLLGEGKHVAPVAINLIKNLPVASGIGGGSADAAAALQGLKDFWKCDTDLVPIANRIGADVAMCLHSVPLRARGVGDLIAHLEMPQALSILLVNPGVEISTPTIFQNLSTKENPPIADLQMNQMPGIDELNLLRNDLQPVAVQMEPGIAEVLNALKDTNASLVRMSGSGATCFAIYNTLNDAKQAELEVSAKHPNWWYMATQTTMSGEQEEEGHVTN